MNKKSRIYLAIFIQTVFQGNLMADDGKFFFMEEFLLTGNAKLKSSPFCNLYKIMDVGMIKLCGKLMGRLINRKQADSMRTH